MGRTRAGDDAAPQHGLRGHEGAPLEVRRRPVPPGYGGRSPGRPDAFSGIVGSPPSAGAGSGHGSPDGSRCRARGLAARGGVAPL
eukprot:1672123-Alexandrium_andersonii.AAC.1